MSSPTSNIRDNLLSSVPPSSVRVLVVDDNEPLRRLFVRSLEEGGFEVHSAENGVQAAELLATSSFHVIVSDVNMPEMDGLALLRLVRERDLQVPFVLLPG